MFWFCSYFNDLFFKQDTNFLHKLFEMMNCRWWTPVKGALVCPPAPREACDAPVRRNPPQGEQNLRSSALSVHMWNGSAGFWIDCCTFALKKSSFWTEPAPPQWTVTVSYLNHTWRRVNAAGRYGACSAASPGSRTSRGWVPVLWRRSRSSVAAEPTEPRQQSREKRQQHPSLTWLKHTGTSRRDFPPALHQSRRAKSLSRGLVLARDWSLRADVPSQHWWQTGSEGLKDPFSTFIH